jgi:hypothetical protein
MRMRRDILANLSSIGDARLPAFRLTEAGLRQQPARGGGPEPPQEFEPPREGSLQVGYGLAGFRPAFSASAAASPPAVLDDVSRAGVVVYPEGPAESWWPGAGADMPAYTLPVDPFGEGLDWPQASSASFAGGHASEDPTMSWPYVACVLLYLHCAHVKRRPQVDDWDAFFKDMTGGSFSQWEMS